MSQFKTTEVSDPLYESANLRFLTVKSPSLKGRGDICVFVPDNAELQNLPVVILLHGVYGSAWIWSLKGAAHITAKKLIETNEIAPMILAMPSDGLFGDGSAYLPHHSINFEKWIVDDVRHAILENIPQSSEKSKIFISGLSMGGFGALRIGSKYPKIFSGISAHSAITSLDQMSLFVEESLDNYCQENKTDEDVLATVLKNKEHLPPIRFDCGANDQLIEFNRSLHQALNQHKIPHQYQEFEGAHEWPYWINHLKDTLLFFNKISLSNPKR